LTLTFCCPATSCNALQGEISSLSCEQHPGSELVVSLFEVPFSAESVAAFIAREHEFRFLAVQPYDLTGQVPTERLAVSANSSNDSSALTHFDVHEMALPVFSIMQL
jgi:hypothetical protein